MNLFDLSGKTAVVTGASGALGGAMAEGLALAGANVVLCYGRNKAPVVERIERLKPLVSGRLEMAQVDSTDAEATRAHAAQVREHFGSIDILLNCAGGNVTAAITGKGKTFFDLDVAPLHEVVHLNFFGGCIYPCMYYGKIMAENPNGGSIINITSMNTFRPLEGRPGYAASKAAVTNFTQWLATHIAKECNPLVRVNAIAPGFIPNARTLTSLRNPDGSYTERGQKIITNTPMARLGTPEDLVGTCIWYAADASRYVTGTVTPVDGGFNAYSGV